MVRQTRSSWGRRQILRIAGASAVGALAVSQLPSVDAQEDADISLKADDQESDGESIVITSLQTTVDAELLIVKSEAAQITYKLMTLDAGTEFSNRTIELDTSIPTTQEITITLRPEDQSLSEETQITVAVGEPLSEVRPPIQMIEADPDAGFHYPYFLYRPDEPADGERPLFVQGNNTPSADDNYEVHRQQAENAINRLRQDLAELFQSPALVPAFPRFREEPVRWDVYAQTLNAKSLRTDFEKLARPDEQLLAMVDHATERLAEEGFTIADQINLFGYSASATFANRFTILHPERVNAVATGGNGATTLPRTELDGQTLLYPAGVADLTELVGKEFNADAWKTVDQYIFVGREDQPLPEDGRGYKGFYSLSDDRQELMLDIFGENRVTERFPVTRSVYNEAGAAAEFKIYDGIGHQVTPEIVDDLRAFYRTPMTPQDVKFNFSAQKSAGEIVVGNPVTVTVTVENRFTEAATATVTLAVDENTIDTREVQLEPIERATIEMETTFEDPGQYTLSVNGNAVGDPINVVTEETPQPTTADPDSSTPESGDVTAAEQPGFGIVQTIAAVGSIGYLLKQNLKDE